MPWELYWSIVNGLKSVALQLEQVVAFIGLYLTLGAILLAGNTRLQRVDCLCCMLWLLLMAEHFTLFVQLVPYIKPIITEAKCGTSAVVIVSCLWAILCSRPCARIHRKSKRKLKKHSNGSFYSECSNESFASVGSSDDESVNLFKLQQGAFAVENSISSFDCNEIGKKLTISNDPQQNQLKGHHIFTLPSSLKEPDGDTCASSNAANSLNSFVRKSRPLISPAKFVHRSSRDPAQLKESNSSTLKNVWIPRL